MGRTGGLSIPGGRGLPSIPGRGGLPTPGGVPRVEIEIPPRYADDVYDIEDVPGDIPDGPPPPRDLTVRPTPDRVPERWEDVNVPPHRNPSNLVPGLMTAGIGGLAWLLSKGLSGTGDTAKLVEEQRPGPEGELLEDPRLSPVEKRARAGSDTARRYVDRQRFASDGWRAKAYLAGGSNNLHSGNHPMWNQFLALNPPGALEDYELNDAQKQMIIQNMPINPLRAKIEEAQLNRAAELAASAIQGQLKNALPDPAKEMLAQEYARKRQDEMFTWAEKHVKDNYSWNPNDWGGDAASGFDENEQQSATEDLAARFRIPESEARTIIDFIARKFTKRK